MPRWLERQPERLTSKESALELQQRAEHAVLRNTDMGRWFEQEAQVILKDYGHQVDRYLDDIIDDMLLESEPQQARARQSEKKAGFPPSRTVTSSSQSRVASERSPVDQADSAKPARQNTQPPSYRRDDLAKSAHRRSPSQTSALATDRIRGLEPSGAVNVPSGLNRQDISEPARSREAADKPTAALPAPPSRRHGSQTSMDRSLTSQKAAERSSLSSGNALRRPSRHGFSPSPSPPSRHGSPESHREKRTINMRDPNHNLHASAGATKRPLQINFNARSAAPRPPSPLPPETNSKWRKAIDSGSSSRRSPAPLSRRQRSPSPPPRYSHRSGQDHYRGERSSRSPRAQTRSPEYRSRRSDDFYRPRDRKRDRSDDEDEDYRRYGHSAKRGDRDDRSRREDSQHSSYECASYSNSPYSQERRSTDRSYKLHPDHMGGRSSQMEDDRRRGESEGRRGTVPRSQKEVTALSEQEEQRQHRPEVGRDDYDQRHPIERLEASQNGRTKAKEPKKKNVLDPASSREGSPVAPASKSASTAAAAEAIEAGKVAAVLESFVPPPPAISPQQKEQRHHHQQLSQAQPQLAQSVSARVEDVDRSTSRKRKHSRWDASE